MFGFFVLTFLSFFGIGATDGKIERRQYEYRNYEEMMDYFDKLKREYPDLVETWIAQEIFPEMLHSRGGKPWGQCNSRPCETLIVRIANKELLKDKAQALRRPEVFFSGALHGDEQIGPAVVTEMAGFLCSQYREGHPEVRRLVDGRNTWIMPMTNAEGFANHHRYENGMDPNRDFPYLQVPQQCMRTQTGRAVNELFRRHLFHFTMTFHGGMRALTYEWGSRNHMKQGRSTESPDDSAFTEFGEVMRQVSGRDDSSKPWYPFGRINDLVYPVDGGMEDWSYGAGFENSETPITVCRPRTYGGYNASRTIYKPGSLSTLVYLAEMDDAKTPREHTLGNTAEIWSLGNNQGHIARNLRMCLKMIEYAKPEVILEPRTDAGAIAPGSELVVGVRGFGCTTLNSAKLLLMPVSAGVTCGTLGHLASVSRQEALDKAVHLADLPAAVQCQGLTIWEPAKPSSELRGKVPADLVGTFCAVVAAEFDQAWGKQSNPDPQVRPRSFAARLRLEDHYSATATEGLDHASGDPMFIDEYRIKLFPVLPEPLRLQSASQPQAPVSAASVAVTSTSPPVTANQEAAVTAVQQLATATLPVPVAAGSQKPVAFRIGTLLVPFALLVSCCLLPSVRRRTCGRWAAASQELPEGKAQASGYGKAQPDEVARMEAAE